MFAAIILAAEGAHEPNGVILPSDINEVIWGSIAFLIVMGVLIWKGGPGIKSLWNGRIERISSELDEAVSARSEAEARLADVQGRIANADQERQRIRTEAAGTAAALRDQIAARTETDLVEISARAVADAEASKAQVVADLQSELTTLTVGAAEQVVARNLDPGTQNDLIEAYISSVGGVS